MRGDQIPLVTWYRTKTGGGVETFKRPKYVLKSVEEVKAEQVRLGSNASWYYGTNCAKCCGVYPQMFTEETFDDNAYYVCPVCGKESEHAKMPWQARQKWNAGAYKWEPTEEPTGYRQLTLFDFIGG